MSSPRTSPPKVILLVCIMSILALSILIFFEDQTVVLVDPKASYQEIVRQTETLIRREGPESAYKIAETIALTLPDNESHYFMHAFGEALYDTIGLEGIVICDGRFQRGCLHQFTARAVSERGTDVIAEISHRCEGSTNSRSCIHGVGHGILSTQGYEVTDIVPSLVACEQAPREMQKLCFGGVFMEYNLRMLASDALLDPRPFDEGDPYSPCFTDLLSGYRETCFYWLPMWWHYSVNRGAVTEDEVLRMGSFCKNVANDSLGEACYRGIGFVVGADASDVRMDAKCRAVSVDEEYRTICLKEAKKRSSAFEI